MDSYDDLIIGDKPIYFVHIPKTSGSALNSTQIIKCWHKFNVPFIYNTPASKGGFHMHEFCEWPVYTYPIEPNCKITIIRNPFDLLASYYFHGIELMPNKQYCHSGWASCNSYHQFKSFKEFITAYCDPNFEWHQPALHRFLFSQLFDINHNCVTDIIIKYEYLSEAIDILNTKLKYPIEHNIVNKSHCKTKNYTEYYDEEMIELVNNKCKRELEYFNYDYNGSTKKEPLILNCNLKYDVYNDKIIN